MATSSSAIASPQPSRRDSNSSAPWLSPARDAANSTSPTNALSPPAASVSPSWPLALSPRYTMPVASQLQVTLCAPVQDALDQSLALVSRMQEQLQLQESSGALAAPFSRDLVRLEQLLSSARTQLKCKPVSAFDFQRSLQQDLRKRARASVVKEDLDVIDWLAASYNAPTGDDEEGNERASSAAAVAAAVAAASASPPAPVRLVDNFRSTILCMRFLKRVRSSIQRRVLRESAWGSITAMHLADPVQTVLARVGDWDFDLFELERLTGPRLLQVLAMHILTVRLGTLERFSIPPACFANFFAAIESGYNDVPYHSHVHAADVLHSTFYFLSCPAQRALLTDLDVLSGCVAAAMHDYGHPGSSNAFQVMTGSATALRYNDRAVLENMHVSEAFLVLRRPHHDIFLNLSPAERAEARATIIHIVLATDMSQHFRNLAELRAQIDAHRAKAQEFSVNNPADRLLCLETALHCADLANPTKPLSTYIEWTRRIYDEFYAQGDEERRRGLPISAMCDRYRPSVERSQIGFIDFIVQPVFDAYSQLNGEIASSCLVHVQRNRDYYSALVARLPPSVTPVATPNAEEEK